MTELALAHRGGSRPARVGPARSGWGRVALVACLSLFIVAGFFTLAFGRFVLNGTASLPHHGYLMWSWPNLPVRGAYVAFAAPKAVDQRFQNFSFVKRIVGLPGDLVKVKGATVCVEADCRTLLPELLERGLMPLAAGPVPEGSLVVFGDAPDSLDSRYGRVGFIAMDSIEAMGFPIPSPHWKELRRWLHGE